MRSPQQLASASLVALLAAILTLTPLGAAANENEEEGEYENLRVLFKAADRDGDSKLTVEEVINFHEVLEALAELRETHRKEHQMGKGSSESKKKEMKRHHKKMEEMMQEMAQ